MSRLLNEKNAQRQINRFKNFIIDFLGIEEANAMCLATASKSGMPSARYVLLKVRIFKVSKFTNPSEAKWHLFYIL